MWLRGGLYDEWASYLERWAQGNDAGLDRLPVLDPALLRADTLDRLVRRITDAISARLQDWADRLVADLGAAGDEFSQGRALAQARTGLRNVRLLARHPALPADLRARLLEMVDRQVISFQQSLEEQTSRDAGFGNRSQIEARRRALRQNPLTAVLHESAPDESAPAAAPQARDDWFVDPTRRPTRRIVTD
jgi:hypothetical protein